jgi:aspartyl-tRNA(Asn)/glutamyl-tRNA(Gln) amidotransferase subunit C
MAITFEQVEYIAKLARLEFSDSEKDKLAGELNKILQYMDKLNELDTSGVEPLSHPIEVTNVMRFDEVKPSLSSEEALKNAPSKEKGFFKVPKVIK